MSTANVCGATQPFFKILMPACVPDLPVLRNMFQFQDNPPGVIAAATAIEVYGGRNHVT